MTDSKTPEQRDEQDDRRRGAVPEEEKVENKRLIKRLREWLSKRWVEIVVFAVVVALYLLISYALWRFLNYYIEPGNDPAQKRGLVQAMGLILVGLAGAIGIYFTWRGQQLAREAQAYNQVNTREQLRLTRDQLDLAVKAQNKNQENTQKELNLTRQGQMTERFTQAIGQLGSDKQEIKLGGIYSLERTAKEEKNYHWPVMEVLTSYVRIHAARKPDKESRENTAIPEPEIQAILDVIGSRSEDHRTDKKVEYGTIDLNNTDLRGTNLQKAFLKGADLRGAFLQRADLQGADLQDADLQDADLRGANLRGAILRGAILRGAILPGADLRGANLQDANLRGASGITEDQIEWTIGSNETELGEDLNRPELWSNSVEEQVKIIREHIVGG